MRETFAEDLDSNWKVVRILAVEERLREDVDGSIDSDGQYVSGTPRFNETQRLCTS